MSNDASERVSEKLQRWFWNGPSYAGGTDGTPGFFLGMLLWWRMLAVCGIVTASLGVVLYLTTFTDSAVALAVGVVAWQVGTFTGIALVRIGPKYHVERNY